MRGHRRFGMYQRALLQYKLTAHRAHHTAVPRPSPRGRPRPAAIQECSPPANRHTRRVDDPRFQQESGHGYRSAEGCRSAAIGTGEATAMRLKMPSNTAVIASLALFVALS